MHGAQVLPQLVALAVDQSVNLLAALVILVVGWIAANAAARWVHRALARLPLIDPTLRPLVASILRYAIIAFAIMAVLERFGVRTTSVIAVLGAAGLAVGLALQGTLSNVASGVLLLLLRTFRVGDEICVAGSTGKVREIGLFRTVLVSGDGVQISLPNATLFSDPIINNSSEPTRQVNFKIVMDHTQDISRAETIALDAIHANKRVLKNPAPSVTVAALGDFDVTLSIAAWTLNGDYGSALSELQQGVREAFRKAGIRPPQRLVGIAGGGSAAGAAATEELRRRTA